jgi:hypothetical protein
VVIYRGIFITLAPGVNFIQLQQKVNGQERKVAMHMMQLAVRQEKLQRLSAHRVLIFSANIENFVRKCFVKWLFLKQLFCHLR